ncbi:MAG: hypothetical protein WA154_15325 [Moraxellaceae bacterium]
MLSHAKTLLSIGLACCLSVHVHAETTTTENTAPDPAAQNAVEFKQSLPTTMEEIATVDVLGEICPKILGERMNRQFNQGYQHLVSSLLPNIPSPSVAIQSLRSDAEYSKLLDIARADTARYAVAENRAVCLDVLHYPAPTQ